MDNGCPQCKKLFDEHIIGELLQLCIDCRLEQAEHDVLRDMNIVEQLKKEKENELSDSKK